MKTQKLDYYDGNTILEAYIAYPKNTDTPRPAVLVVHDWSGKNEFACKKADALAEMGYIGVAIDMFGKGVLGNTVEGKQQLIAPFLADLNFLQQRIKAAYTAVTALDTVNSNKIAAMGFCFGGLCVLNLAYSDANIKGVVSFHGLLGLVKPSRKIKAKILALHGYRDPMVTVDNVNAFEQEMAKAEADWQLHIYGNAKHAFMNPLANDENLGTVYNAVTEKRAWITAQNFLVEIFSE